MKFRKYIYIFVGLFFLFASFFLGYRLFTQTRHSPPRIPRETNVNLIQDWMTIEYIGKTYRVPPPEIFKKLGFDFTSGKISVLELSKKNNIDASVLVIKIQNIITEFQTTNPTPPGIMR